MNKSILVLFIGLSIFLAGCSTSLANYTSDYQRGINANTNKGIFDYDAFGACETGTCQAFVCGYGESTLCEYATRLGMAGNCPFNSLKGGSCQVVDNFYQREYEDYNNPSIVGKGADHQVMQFMIGQGASFGDFSEANRYCNNRLTLSTKWLVGTLNSQYKSSDSERAGCFLDRDIMPMYIQYSDSKNVDVDSARQNALSLNGIGPAIITAEMNFNSSDPTVLANVKQQIKAMKAACPNCLVALAPRMGESKAILNEFLNDSNDPQLNKSIDLVAFGVDGRYSSTCNGDKLYLADALPFARMLNYDFGKPSIIAYIMVDEGGRNALSLNPVLRDTCTWDRPNTLALYSSFFSDQIQSFRESGVIGASLYSFNTTFGNPLNCDNCAMGLDNEKLNTWFGWCQAYHHGTAEIKAAANLPSISFGINPTIFSSGPGGCNLSTTNLGAYTGITYANRDFSQPQNPPLQQPVTKSSFTCESCVAQDISMPSVDITNTGFDSAKMCGPSTNTEIDKFIKQYSEQRDIDESLVRAVIWQETSFTDNVGKDGQCTISIVSFSNRGCNPNNINTAGANGLTDPAGICDAAIQAAATGIQNSAPLLPTPQKFCAYGLMQNIEYPSLLYPGGLPQIIVDSGCLDTEGQFNPFAINQSICLGTYKLKTNTEIVRSRITDVDDYQVKLGLKNPDGTIDSYKSTLYSAYVALHIYYGDFTFGTSITDPNNPEFTLNINSIVDTFGIYKILDPSTCVDNGGGFFTCSMSDGTNSFSSIPQKCIDTIGEQDFVKYGRKCIMDDGSGSENGDYGSSVLSKYKKLITSCSNAICPSDQKLFSEMSALYPPPANPP